MLLTYEQASEFINNKKTDEREKHKKLLINEGNKGIERIKQQRLAVIKHHRDIIKELGDTEDEIRTKELHKKIYTEEKKKLDLEFLDYIKELEEEIEKEKNKK